MGNVNYVLNFGHKIFALEILCNNIHSYLLYKMSREESFIILSKTKKKQQKIHELQNLLNHVEIM